MKIFPSLLLSMLIIASTWAKKTSEILGLHDFDVIDTLTVHADL